MRIDQPDAEAGEAMHSPMHSRLGQQAAMQVVRRIGGDGANLIGGINKLEVDLAVTLLEFDTDLRLEPEADIVELLVSRLIVAFDAHLAVHIVGTSAFRNDDNHVLLRLELLFNVLEEAVFAV